MDVENLVTLDGVYLLEEIKEGFDEFKLGDTDIDIQIRPRQGVGKYVNYSKRCRVIYAPANAKYDIGESIWTPHMVANNVVDGERISESLKGKKVFYCREQNIMFKGDDLTAIKSDEWIVFQIKQGGFKEGVVITYEQPDDTKGVVVCGALPKGTNIEWYTHKRQEFYQKEVQYWVTHIDDVVTINGEVNPDCVYYETNTFGDMEFREGGLLYTGQAAIARTLGVGFPLAKKHFIAKLNNPSLEHHGKTGIVRRSRKGRFVHQDEVLAIL